MKKNNNILMIFVLVILMISLVSCKTTEIDPLKPADPKDPSEVVEPVDPTEPTEPMDPIVELKPYPIGLIVSGYKSVYAINEEFEKSIEKAEVLYSDNTKKEVTQLIQINDEYYDGSKNGTYEIIMSYNEDLNNTTYVVKTFFFAIVGTGNVNNENNNNNDEKKVFGPGTYEFDASIDLINYEQSAAVNVDTKFSEGFFVMKGAQSKRANASAYALELVKAEGSWIEFEINKTATVTIVCSSTGSNNTSVIAVFNDESQLIQNNEAITTLSGTTQMSITYTLTTGLYRILSQANTSYSVRGVRIYKVTVVQN